MRHTRPKSRHRRLRSAIAAVLGFTLIGSLALPASPAAADDPLVYDLAISNVVTGSAPFDATEGPGNDTTPTDAVVRAWDTVTYTLSASANPVGGGAGSAPNATFVFTLPVGMTWNTLPGTCLAIPGHLSGISPDGRTATCNSGDVTFGSSADITLTALVSSVTNGTPLAFAADAITFATDNDATAPVTAQPATLTASAVPNINMTKVNNPYVQKGQVGPDGVTPGWRIQYGVTLSIPNLPTKGRKGYATPTQPVTFVDDLSQISPNASLVMAAANNITNHGELPNFNTNGAGQANQINNGGTWAAAVDPGDPQKVTVTVTGADLTGSHIPTLARNGSAITDRIYMTFGYIVVFVPLSDVPVDATGSGSKVVVNTINSLVANAPNLAGPTLTNIGDDPADNIQSMSLVRQTAGEFSKRFVDIINNTSTPYLSEGMTSDRAGNGTLTVGQQVQSYIIATNTSSEGAFSSMMLCDIWDSTALKLASYRVLPSARWENPTGVPVSATGDGAALGHFEYLTGYTPSSDDTTRWAQMRAFNCANTAGTWTTQTAALADPTFDLGAVAAIRYVNDAPIPAGAVTTMLTNLEARPAVSNGQIVANMGGWRVAEIANNQYRGNAFVPETNKTAGGGVSTTGDRLINVIAPLGITKAVIDPAGAGTPRVSAGAPAQFQLTPGFRTVGRPLPFSATDVTVTDTIPSGLTFVLDDGVVAGTPVTAPSMEPESVTVNNDGSTTVVWRIPSMSSTAPAPVISYWVASNNTSRGDYVNTAVVRSPSDAQSPPASLAGIPLNDPHLAQATIGVDGRAGISISKLAMNPMIDPGGDFTFEVTSANGSQAGSQTGGVVIDVLPFVGDGSAGLVSKVPPTDNAATYALAGPVTSASAIATLYTFDDPATVQAAQLLGAGQGPDYGAGITWLPYDSVRGRLADVTAIRVALPDISPLGTVAFRYTLTHLAGQEGGLFANNSTLRTAQSALGVLSNTVTTRLDAGVPEIGLVKSASAPVNGTEFLAGETVTFRFVVTNTGAVILNNVGVTEGDFVNGAGDPITLSTPIVSDPAGFNGTLAPGASATFTADYLVTEADAAAEGNLSNTATATGESAAGETVDADSDVDVNVGIPEPALLLTKTVSNSPASGGFVVGDTVEYAFTVRNTGNVPVTGVTVTEDSFRNATGQQLTLTSGPEAPAGFTGTLTAGEQVVFTGSYEVTAADLGGVLTNVASVVGEAPDDTVVTDNSTAVAPTGGTAPGLSVTGAEGGAWAALAAVLVALGIGLVGRRRQA